jgi:hypothetical protein
MKLKKLIILIISGFILINIAILFLLLDGNSRYNGFRLIAEGQNFIFQQKLGRYVGRKDFGVASEILEERLDYLKGLSNDNNTQTQDYFNDIKKSFDTTVSKEEKSLFKETFRKISSAYPRNYQMHLFFAETLDEDEINLAFKEIDKAIELLGSSSEAYRLGMTLAWRSEDSEKFESYCSAYKKNQFGGLYFTDLDPNQMQELGLRRLGLNIQTSKGNIFIENNGIEMGKEVEYEFTFPEPLSIDDNFSLFFPMTAGTSVNIKNINYYKNGLIVKSDNNSNFIITSSGSFFDERGSLLLSNKSKPETATILFRSKPEKLIIDKMNLRMIFKRQALFSNPECLLLN